MQDFAYKITIGFGVFCLAGVIALVVALISIGFVAMKAALANPVDAVRYE